ncbi:hypothetical protein MAHJHV35_47950 [Mycobacterium avium subsp. hominissuis]
MGAGASLGAAGVFALSALLDPGTAPIRSTARRVRSGMIAIMPRPAGYARRARHYCDHA